MLSGRVGGRKMFDSLRVPCQKSHEAEYVKKKTDQEIIKKVMIRKKKDHTH